MARRLFVIAHDSNNHLVERLDCSIFTGKIIDDQGLRSIGDVLSIAQENSLRTSLSSEFSKWLSSVLLS